MVTAITTPKEVHMNNSYDWNVIIPYQTTMSKYLFSFFDLLFGQYKRASKNWLLISFFIQLKMPLKQRFNLANRIRTYDNVIPNHAFYQTELYPANNFQNSPHTNPKQRTGDYQLWTHHTKLQSNLKTYISL